MAHLNFSDVTTLTSPGHSMMHSLCSTGRVTSTYVNGQRILRKKRINDFSLQKKLNSIMQQDV